MSERSHRTELIVATGHDLLITPERGGRHAFAAPREEGQLDQYRIVRAQEERTARTMVTIELEDGQRRELPLFEITYKGLDYDYDMRRLMARAILSGQVVVASRIGGRYLHRTGQPVEGHFGHPARIIRDEVSGALLSAQQIGLPQPTDYRGPENLEAIDTLRPLDRPVRLVNYLPEDMYLQKDGERLHVANCGFIADVDFNYDPIAETPEGVPIARSTPLDVTGMPEPPGPNELRLVHTEVLFESLRLGIVGPEEASHMVIACGVRRMPSGQQGNTFTGLAYYSVETLREIYQRIRI